ncbi:MAG: HNH endonuclease signature motif containing protein [Chloroflexi bacterium]|nr:HNH endonuclease signature motif containing protein [Chloroflexota bacterium]MCY3697303.1 HNH endonuclease signature motif containing protein [Chloroflexota bacterium]
MARRMNQKEFIFSYYQERPNVTIPHAEVVDWATAEWEQRTGKKLRDPDRMIRKLHQEGMLQKLGNGSYRYDPDLTVDRMLEDFSSADKQEILKQDGYRCVICGASRAEGVELHVDHIKPKDRGGRATIENGQTLCAMHNYRKKNLGQTETGKKMFIRLYDVARDTGDKQLCEFIRDVLKTYERHNINGHIVWRDPVERG